MKRFLLACVFLLLALPAAAQYATPTIASIDQPDKAGRVRVVVTFTGTNVKSADREYFPEDMTVFSSLVYADLAELNRKSSATKPLQVQTVVLPPGQIVSTPEQIQLQRFQRDIVLAVLLKSYVDLGVTAAQADLSIVVADAIKLYMAPQGMPTP